MELRSLLVNRSIRLLLRLKSRTKRTSVGGIKLALLEKKTRGDLVTGVLQFHFGNEVALRGRTTAGSLAGALLMTGTQKYNMTQLQDEMTRLKADLNVSGDDKHITIRVKVPKENLAAALRLAAEIVRNPAFPEDQFNQIKQMLAMSVSDSPPSAPGSRVQSNSTICVSVQAGRLPL